MKPDTFYFPHDYNSVQDHKIITLLNRCGLEGLGAYWIIVELLHQQNDAKVPYLVFENHIKMYGKLNNKTEEQLSDICSCLIETELFKKEGDFVFSERVKANKQHREEIAEKRSFAGKKSAEKRFGNQVEPIQESKPKKTAVVNKDFSDSFKYLKDEKFNKTFDDYLEMRTKIKKSATNRAKEMALAFCHKFDISTAISILEQSIINSWSGVFELKQQSSKPVIHNNWDSQIAEKLGKIADKDSIKTLMMIMPKPLWFKIDAFLKNRYSGYTGKSFNEAQREVIELNKFRL
jgi:hypothetical protein